MLLGTAEQVFEIKKAFLAEPLQFKDDTCLASVVYAQHNSNYAKLLISMDALSCLKV